MARSRSIHKLENQMYCIWNILLCDGEINNITDQLAIESGSMKKLKKPDIGLLWVLIV